MKYLKNVESTVKANKIDLYSSLTTKYIRENIREDVFTYGEGENILKIKKYIYDYTSEEYEKKCQKAKYLFQNQKMQTYYQIVLLKIFVQAGKITIVEYKEITGEDYIAQFFFIYKIHQIWYF